MNKKILTMVLALFSCASYAQDPKISIKGIEIGLTQAEVANITGTQSRYITGFRVGGVHGDIGYSFSAGKLSLAMFRFNSGNFQIIKEAYTEKYKEMKCTDSEIQNAMGAKFEQTTCIYKDDQGIIELEKYVKINQSQLKIKSTERIEQEMKENTEKKKDI